MSISTFLDTQEFFQEAKQDEGRVHGWLLRNHMSGRKWPILDIRRGLGSRLLRIVRHPPLAGL